MSCRKDGMKPPSTQRRPCALQAADARRWLKTKKTASWLAWSLSPTCVVVWLLMTGALRKFGRRDHAPPVPMLRSR
jgi:hypothetical protein